MKKKGFTLIELLAVIIILAIIALIATPVVLNVIDKAKRQANKDSAYGLIDASKLYYIESMLDTSKQSNINGSTDLLDKIKISGRKPDEGTIYVDNKGEVAIAVVYDKVCYKKNFSENDLSESEDIENCKLDIDETKVVYNDPALNGADPVLSENLIPVIISDDGTVRKADTEKEWYNYENKEWANAVKLKDRSITYEINEVIKENNIDGYFVWLPRYKYEIFNVGNYTTDITVSSKPTTSKAQEVNIVFESKDVAVSNGNTVGSYLTHPAFTSLDVNGLWIGKFETSGSKSDIDIIPNVTSLRKINVKTMFELAYNYDRSLDSHMMKNTEWGAVAYLSHSKYGINSEVRINNSSTFITGCSATTNNNYVDYDGCENEYNTSIGYLASTTGNITGIYDMSGGSYEYMASYMNGTYGYSGFDDASIALYDSKYFDIYPSDSTGTYGDRKYNNRILGDATGELGPFYYYGNKIPIGVFYGLYNSWYGETSSFICSDCIDSFDYPWFVRGNCEYYAGLFVFTGFTGDSYNETSFRLVLS